MRRKRTSSESEHRGTMELLNLLIDAIRLSIGGACIITAIISGLIGLIACISCMIDNQSTKDTNYISAITICTIIAIVATILAYIATPELIGHI